MPVRGEIGHRRFDVHLFLWGAVCYVPQIQRYHISYIDKGLSLLKETNILAESF